MKEYKRMPFPWTSKSKIKARDYCDYSFYLKYVKKEHEEKRQEAVEGTNLHMVFANFYRHLKPEHVFREELIDAKTTLHSHPMRRFIYEACMKFIKPNHRSWGKYKNIISNFATIETERWLRLNTLLNNKDEIFECFKPLYIEKRLEYEPVHLFGTIDRINIEVMPDKTKKIAIYDYKTGNVPKGVYTHKDMGKMFDWDLRSDLMKEIHFYGLLYLLNTGWNLSTEIHDFLNKPEWWYIKKDNMSYKQSLKDKGKYLTSLQKNYKLFKEGKLFKKGEILVGFYYLNGDKGYRPVKEYNYASHKSVIQAVNDLRSAQHNSYYVKHPKFVFDEDACGYKNCHRVSKCREEIELYNKAVKEGKIK